MEPITCAPLFKARRKTAAASRRWTADQRLVPSRLSWSMASNSLCRSSDCRSSGRNSGHEWCYLPSSFQVGHTDEPNPVPKAERLDTTGPPSSTGSIGGLSAPPPGKMLFPCREEAYTSGSSPHVDRNCRLNCHCLNGRPAQERTDQHHDMPVHTIRAGSTACPVRAMRSGNQNDVVSGASTEKAASRFKAVLPPVRPARSARSCPGTRGRRWVAL